MPDLLTHTLLNAALPVGTLRPRHLLCFVAGGVLPDFASRVPGLFVARVIQPLIPTGGPDIDWLIMGHEFLHVPLGVGLLAVLLAAACPRFLLGGVARWSLCALLVGGAAVHLGVDVMQEHLRPGYRYLYPFSLRPCELGWFSAEASLTWWSWLIPSTALSLGVSAWRWRQNDARLDQEAEAGA